MRVVGGAWEANYFIRISPRQSKTIVVKNISVADRTSEGQLRITLYSVFPRLRLGTASLRSLWTE